MGKRVFKQDGFSCPLSIQRCFARNKTSGTRCMRRSFRHPYCIPHARHCMGIYPRRSTIAGAGCGMFASRDLKNGDVIGPYTGEVFADVSTMREQRAGVIPVYSMKSSGGNIVDASCMRGYGGYINEPPRGVATSNVRWKATTIPRDPVERGRCFGPPDPDTGLCVVLSQRFKKLGWRRISYDLLANFAGVSFPWMWVTKNVPKDTELFLPYRGGGVHMAVIHHTKPPLSNYIFASVKCFTGFVLLSQRDSHKKNII